MLFCSTELRQNKLLFEEVLEMKEANGNGTSKLDSKGKNIRCKMITEAAYYRAERRGFQDGDPVVDWLTAEAEIDDKLTKIFPFLNNRVLLG
jgi:hypothetical protein